MTGQIEVDLSLTFSSNCDVNEIEACVRRKDTPIGIWNETEQIGSKSLPRYRANSGKYKTSMVEYVLSSIRLAYRAIIIFQSFLKAGLQSIFLLYRSKSRASRADRYESSTATKSWWSVPHAAGQALESLKMTDRTLPTSLKSIPCSGPYHPDHSPMSTIMPFWINWTLWANSMQIIWILTLTPTDFFMTTQRNTRLRRFSCCILSRSPWMTVIHCTGAGISPW